MTSAPPFDAQAFVDAWNTRDLNRIMAFYAEDAALLQSGIPEPIAGRDAVRQAMATFLTTFHDTRAEVREHVQTGDRVVLLIGMSGTYAGDLQVGRERTLPAEGKRVEWEVVSFLTLNEAGEIVRDRALVDSETMLQQLGILPSVRAAGDAEHQH